MRIRRARVFVISLLALAFVVGSLSHGPAMMLTAAPTMDCHQSADGEGPYSTHDGHGAPLKILFGCPLANLAAYAPSAPSAATIAMVRMVMEPLPAPLLTSASLESADPPPRGAAS
jgi:hypothetical protein